jgi:flagellar motor switch protein FliG
MAQTDGLEDAAILMMSLGEAEAAEVFKHLSPKEVQKLGEAIAKTKAITRERVDEVVDKFTGVARPRACWCPIRGTMCARCSSARWATTRRAAD